MANHSEASVRFVNTTGTFDNARKIVGIKYLGAAASSITIRAGSASGGIIWSEDGTTDIFEQVKITCTEGIHVTVVGTAEAFIYLA